MDKPYVFLVFPRAWRMGLSAHNIRCGFAMTGIWPIDITAISDEVFATAEELSELLFTTIHPTVLLFMLCC